MVIGMFRGIFNVNDHQRTFPLLLGKGRVATAGAATAVGLKIPDQLDVDAISGTVSQLAQEALGVHCQSPVQDIQGLIDLLVVRGQGGGKFIELGVALLTHQNVNSIFLAQFRRPGLQLLLALFRGGNRFKGQICALDGLFHIPEQEPGRVAVIAQGHEVAVVSLIPNNMAVDIAHLPLRDPAGRNETAIQAVERHHGGIHGSTQQFPFLQQSDGAGFGDQAAGLLACGVEIVHIVFTIVLIHPGIAHLGCAASVPGRTGVGVVTRHQVDGRIIRGAGVGGITADDHVAANKTDPANGGIALQGRVAFACGKIHGPKLFIGSGPVEDAIAAHIQTSLGGLDLPLLHRLQFLVQRRHQTRGTVAEVQGIAQTLGIDILTHGNIPGGGDGAVVQFHENHFQAALLQMVIHAPQQQVAVKIHDGGIMEAVRNGQRDLLQNAFGVPCHAHFLHPGDRRFRGLGGRFRGENFLLGTSHQKQKHQ